AFEIPEEALLQRSTAFAACLASALWPQTLKRLVFDSNMPVDTALWPASLQQISFGYGFDKPIVDVVWPASLQQLSLGDSFDQ
ncbi:unnamed protein product, partial [Ectocarpus fasciculatus]